MKNHVRVLRHLCTLATVLFLIFLGVTNNQPEHLPMQVLIGIVVLVVSLVAFLGLRDDT